MFEGISVRMNGSCHNTIEFRTHHSKTDDELLTWEDFSAHSSMGNITVRVLLTFLTKAHFGRIESNSRRLCFGVGNVGNFKKIFAEFYTTSI